MSFWKMVFLSCLLWVGSAGFAFGQSGVTLERIRKAGSLSCGVTIEQPEYSLEDAHGDRSAFDQDICKAVAVAVLGKDAKFSVVPYRVESEALGALKAGDIALLATGSLKYMNSIDPGLAYSRPIFYDYQGLLGNKMLGVSSAKDLAGKKICSLTGTEIEGQLQAYMSRENIKYLPYSFSEEGEMQMAVVTRNCAAVTADVSQLAYERSTFKGLASQFEILPEAIAKDPLAITYRRGDLQWGAILDWTVEALIEAEEAGVTQANVAEKEKSEDPRIRRLLGTDRGYWPLVGLDDRWLTRVIAAVGNYGELFERDLGSGSPMKLERGPNQLWTHGGLMYARPIR